MTEALIEFVDGLGGVGWPASSPGSAEILLRAFVKEVERRRDSEPKCPTVEAFNDLVRDFGLEEDDGPRI